MELKGQTDTHTPERTSTDCVFTPKPVASMLMTGSSRSTFIPLAAKSRSLNILTWGVMKSYRRTQNHEMTYNLLFPRKHQCKSEKHKATHSLLMWGGYAVNCLFNINLELFCFRNGLRVHTAKTGRIDWSLSSSPPQSVKSAYSPSSRRYWRPSNPGAEYPTQLCMNKNMNHCLSQLKAINQQELRPTKPNPTTSENTHRPLRIFNEPTEQSLFLLVLSGLSVSSSPFFFCSSSPLSKLSMSLSISMYSPWNIGFSKSTA